MAAKTYVAMFEVGGKLQASFHSSFESAGKQFKVLESKSAHAAKKIHHSFEKLGHSIEKAFAPLHKLAHFTGIGAVLGGAVAAFEGAKLLEGGFEIHAEREVLQNQMRAVLASKHREGQLGEIDSMVRRFSDNEAPIKYEPAMEAINRLLSANMDKFKTPEALHTILGNIADLSKDEDSFKHVMDAYVKMQSMHRVDRRYLNQMDLGSGFSVSSEMAKAAGMKPEEFSSAMSKHQISQDKLLKLLDKSIAQLTGEGGPAYQHSKEQMKGLKGIFVRMEERFRDFNDSIGTLEEAFISPIAESFLEFVGPNELKHLFDPIMPQVKQVGHSLRLAFNFLEGTGRFEKTGRRFQEIFGVIFGDLKVNDPWDFVETATAVWDKFNATLRKVENSLIWVRDNFQEVEKWAKIALGVWIGSEVLGVLASIATVTTALWGVATTLWVATAAAWAFAAPFLLNPVTWIIAGIVVVVVALGAAVWWVATHWDTVSKAIRKAWHWVEKKWGYFSSWFGKNVWEPMKEGFKNSINFVIGRFNDLIERLHIPWINIPLIPTFKTNPQKAAEDAVNEAKSGAVRPEPLPPPPPPKKDHALGGIFNTPHLGLVAEAGPEAIIPLNRSRRSLRLLESAAEAMGLGNGASSGSHGNASFHIPVSITINGNADSETLREASTRVAQSIREQVEEVFAGYRATRLA
jgi:hypothetical protein